MSEAYAIAELTALLEQLETRRQLFRLESYSPYPYQRKFHEAKGYLTDVPAKQRALIAGNKVGKTLCASFECAMHATGRYPADWKGTKFDHPVEILVSGITNDSVRDIGQRELLGDPTEPALLGTGSIPKDCIGKARTKAGVQGAYDSIRIRHVSGGWSRIYFRAYEQGWKKFQGIAFDVGWLDEEPPLEVWSQFLRGTIARKNAILFITMTPEEGMTQIVSQFMNDLKTGQAIITASWEDAEHLVKKDGTLTDVALQLWEAIPQHQRKMRRYGTPLYGAGLIFDVDEEEIQCEPFEIPKHFRRINGIDFGWDHPFGAISLAYDRDSDIVYVVSEYRESHKTPPIHAQAVKAWGDWIPVAWPHDGLQTEKGGGEALIKQYRDCGLNTLQKKATNPPDYALGQQEGDGGNSVEAPLHEMLQRMQTGRWKVFKTCTKWLEERRMYHHDPKGKIVKQMDDLISASRYAYMMLRFAITKPVLPRNTNSGAVGLRQWG